MSDIIMMVGNICSGKSVLARKFANRGYAVISMDAIQTGVAGGLYDRYDPKKNTAFQGWAPEG